jgi:hypothetical protein
LIVADPCYLTNKDFAVVVANAKPGRWVAMIGREASYGPWVSSLTVAHESELVRDGAVDRELMRRVGVDTARLVVVDSRSIGCYVNADLGPRLKADQFGLMVPSGFGDGIFDCCVREYAGKSVSIHISFIEMEVAQ